MVGMIGHLGQVSPRRGITCALWHLLGSSLGAAALGSVLGAVGTGIRVWAAGVGVAAPGPFVVGTGLVLCAFLCGLHELEMIRLPLPQRRRQVTQRSWFAWGDRMASFVWGAILGSGVFTFVTYPVYYLVLIHALANPPQYSAALLMTCGFGQGITLVWWTLRTAFAGGRLAGTAWSHRMHRLAAATALGFGSYVFSSMVRVWH